MGYTFLGCMSIDTGENVGYNKNNNIVPKVPVFKSKFGIFSLNLVVFRILSRYRIH